MLPRPDRAGPPRPTGPGRIEHRQVSPRRPHVGTPGGHLRSTSRASDFQIWDGLHQIQADSSSSEEDLHPSPRRASRPRHTRSMSHPFLSFPSLFSSKKKRSGPMAGAAADDDSGSESGGESTRTPSVRGRQQPPPRPGHRNGSSGGSRDFVTGRCMTCGSLVRWPRELHVFKCSICLTVNDLRFEGRPARPEEPQGGSANEKSISLGYTRSLVEMCLRSFLKSTLKKEPADAALFDHESPTTPPPLSPYEHRMSAAASTPPPLTIRHKVSFPGESWPLPSGSRAMAPPGQHHRRAPSWTNTMPRSYSTSYPEKGPALRDIVPRGLSTQVNLSPPTPGAEPRRIFRLLEAYIFSCFTSFQCLNCSFMSPHSHAHVSRGPDYGRHRSPARSEPPREPQTATYLVPDLDPKLLLVADFAENGTWWAGAPEEAIPGRTASGRSQKVPSTARSRNPHVEWGELEEWYTTVVEAARPWSDIYKMLIEEDPTLAVSDSKLQDIEAQILVAQEHVQRTLLKACEVILRRPGRPLTTPEDLRFLLLIAANPLLHASCRPYAGKFPHPESLLPAHSSVLPRGTGPASGRHSVIIKRIIGLMSNVSVECQNHLTAWFARYPESSFVQIKDLVAGFLSYRLLRQNEKKYEARVDVTAGLVPSMGRGQSVASLHAALGQHTPGSSSASKKQKEKKRTVYREDWQIKAAAQVLGFLFAANNMTHARRRPDSTAGSQDNNTRERVQARGQIIPTSDFYTTLLDDSDLVADFDAWEKMQGRFSFCQFPFLLSMGAKMQILEHDARRQMENKARDAFFDSILTNRVVEQYLAFNIRRECLVDDSLKAVREVVGAGGEDVKKGLRITFRGEEGVDAGGLRKEWFLLLVREVFNPDHGMFLYDEDSQYCYFNPNSLEPSEQFFLVGVVFGLAIYNSTILDVALPPFAFRKLVLAAPPSLSQPRQTMTYTLDDLAEYRPRLARGLRRLLEFEGDVESTFCLDFAIDTDRYGATERVPLCPGGASRPVTNANRREYVDAYVRYLLDTAVARQFEPFKRGFYTVCGGSGSPSALSLFRPEEIELLVRGSDGGQEKLDVASLRATAQYEGWGWTTTSGGNKDEPAEREPTVRWFWEAFESAPPRDQRGLLAFITGSDRVPAVGAAALGVRISCLGDDCGRFPTARTCFNALALWRCRSRERLEEVLWRAVRESEGFGLK